MDREDMYKYKVWTIRYSNGKIRCEGGEYEDAVKVAEEHIKGTNLTYTIA